MHSGAMLQLFQIGNLAIGAVKPVFFKDRHRLRMATDYLAYGHFLGYHLSPSWWNSSLSDNERGEHGIRRLASFGRIANPEDFSIFCYSIISGSLLLPRSGRS